MNVPWQPLQQASPVPPNPAIQKLLDQNPAAAKEWAEDSKNLWMNDRYLVVRKDIGPDAEGGRVIWLSIRRLDRAPLRDWRDFQRIKNELCGPEAEAVELYPAESRVVDMANQYHLWVFVGYAFPFGFAKGDRMTADESAKLGSVQREGAGRPI